MANPTQTTLLTPAELRRRLLSPPADSSAAKVVEDEAPPAQSRSTQRRAEAGRFGGATQTAIDLDALMLEVSSPPNPRLTPAPEARLDSSPFRRGDSIPMARPVGPSYGGTAHGAEDELAEIRQQNAELTRIIEEMRPLLEEATAQEGRIQTKEKDFQEDLLEKDLKIEELEVKLKQVEEKLANVPVPKTPKTRDELEEWSDELEQESAKLNQLRRQLDEDRKQLREDEESLERQMREMECSMARERAMMARQETELKRLSAEIQHELELLQRGDGTLREQLSKFQRRHQEVLSRGTGGAPPFAPPAMAEPVAVATAPPPGLPGKKDSGLLRRIFRGNK